MGDSNSPWGSKYVIYSINLYSRCLAFLIFFHNEFIAYTQPAILLQSHLRMCLCYQSKLLLWNLFPSLSQFLGSSLNLLAMWQTRVSPPLGLVTIALTFRKALHPPSWPIQRAYCSSFSSQTFFLEEGSILGNCPTIFKNRNISKIFSRVYFFYNSSHLRALNP